MMGQVSKVDRCLANEQLALLGGTVPTLRSACGFQRKVIIQFLRQALQHHAALGDDLRVVPCSQEAARRL